MSTIPTASIVAIGPQAGKEQAAATFYKHPATAADMTEIDDVRVSPPEISGVPVPSLPYSVGPIVQGGIRLNPRLAGVIGWYLYALTGNCTTTSDSPESGVNSHVFAVGTSTDIPYITARELVHGNVAANDFGRDMSDSKLVTAQFSIGNDGLLPVGFGFMGRKYKHYTATEVATWTWGNADEPDASVPISAVDGAYLKVPGLSADDLPIAGGTVTFTNQPNDIRFERVYGSPYINDVSIISKAITFEFNLIYEDPDVYRAILDGSASGSEWTPQPFTSSVDLLLRSPSNIGSTSTPYSLRLQVPNVMFSVNKGLTLAGNQSVILSVTGTAIKPASGNYATLTLVNDYAAYTWPV